MKSRPLLLLSTLAGAMSLLCLRSFGEGAKLEVADDFWDFQTVKWDSPVEHTFQLGNVGQEPAVIARIGATPPLFVKPVRRRIEPGEWIDLVTVLRTPRPAGDFEGGVEISFRDPKLKSVFLGIKGKIVPPIDVLPRPALVVTTFRGETNQSAVTIVNNEKEPLQLEHLKLESGDPRLSLKLETLESGRKYRLTLALKGEGQVGRVQNTIYLTTSSKEKPVLTIGAFTLVQERVHTFPEIVDLGQIRLATLQGPQAAEKLVQTLMVYQSNGTHFNVKPTSDLPFLRFHSAPSQAGDRCQVTINIDPELLEPGTIEGNIGLQTNDPEFPILNVPVTGEIKAK